MLRFSSERLSPGMVVGRPITDANGRVLLTARQVLNERYIKRIQELKIPMVYVDDQMGVQEPPAVVNPVTISKATKTLKQSYQQCAKTGKTNLTSIQSQIDNIIDDLATNSNILIGMTDLKSYDDYTYQHSVNVCVLAIMLGIDNGYNRSQLQTLGTGALLHDIGKISIPLEILNKTSALTDEEYTIIKKHPWEGFKMIKNSTEIRSLSAYVALQHHERIDGQGYPRGLNEGNIHEYGLIAAVADMFDALVSDRPYRHGYNNQEAIHIVEEIKGTHLAPQFVDILSKHINLYPPGTVVTLTTGDIAIVTHENLKDHKTPQVKLLFNSNQQVYHIDYPIDLAAASTISISNVHTPADAEQIICLYLSLQKNLQPNDSSH